MAPGWPQNQVELTELIAALDDESDDIRSLAGSGLAKLDGLPVVRLLLAFLQNDLGKTARQEYVQ
jgi:HEAT repeat protein